jgi:Flp pilus assembly protein TadG
MMGKSPNRDCRRGSIMSFSRFFRDRKGGVAPLLALSMVPLVGAVGASVDFSRANATRAGLQAALDSALLYVAKGDSANWQQDAATAFNAMVAAKNDASLGTPTFSVDADGNYVGQAGADVPTRISSILGISTLPVSVTSTVKPGGDADNSCILTLDKGSALSNVSMLFGGAPNIQLAGCSTRSNTSTNCNGHAGGAQVSIAAGSTSGCSNPKSYAKQLPDIYAPMASSISKLCGTAPGGSVDWTVGSAVPSAVKMVQVGSYKEYHVCGKLTLSGTGSLFGSNANSDTVIVIENGGLKLSSGASISTTRTAIILTGSASTTSVIDFPQGNGQSAALALSPPIGADNPWKGISMYQNPVMMTNVDNDWGPGATFNADGIVYLPNSDVELQGVAASGNTYKCSKFVTKSFTTKGSVNLNFSQIKVGCEIIGMKQWADIPIHLVK